MSKIIVSFRRTYEIPIEEIERYINENNILLSDKNIEASAIYLAQSLFDEELQFFSASHDDFSAHIIKSNE